MRARKWQIMPVMKDPSEAALLGVDIVDALISFFMAVDVVPTCKLLLCLRSHAICAKYDMAMDDDNSKECYLK